jgi:hypothetical protein
MNIGPQIKGMVDRAGFENVEHVVYKVTDTIQRLPWPRIDKASLDTVVKMA